MSDPESTIVRRTVRTIWSGLRRPLLAGLGLAALGVIVAVVITGSSSGESDDAAATATTAPSDDGGREFAVIEAVDSSWVEGQGSLVTYDAYLAVANRAQDLARTYQEARDAEVARQDRLAGLQREEAERAARERALAAYREALRKAKLERQRQQRLLAERRQRIKERLAELREKYKVDPGEECQIPEVQAVFDCTTGYPF